MVLPVPQKLGESEHENLPPPSSGGIGRKSPSKQLIAFLAIVAVLLVAGLVYLAIRTSQSSPKPAPIAAATPSPSVIATPTVEEKAQPTISATPTKELLGSRPSERAFDTKVDALALMAKAVEPYTKHQDEVAEFMIELDKAYEFERTRPLDPTALTLWSILRDPNRDLLGGFLKQWKEEGELRPVYVEAKRLQIGGAFDQIIEFETKKHQ